MPTYLIHGFRWPRPLVRIHIILQNLDDAAAEWLVAPSTTETLLDNFTELWPQPMANLPNLRFVEQYDPLDESPAAASQPYAYVADICEEVRLGLEVDEVRGKGVGNEQWGALMELRDKLAPDEKVGWFVVVCGDEERWVPQEEEYDTDAINRKIAELGVQQQPVHQQEPVPNGPVASVENNYTNYSDTTSSRLSRHSRNSSERTPTVTTAPTASPSPESPKREQGGLRKFFSLAKKKSMSSLRSKKSSKSLRELNRADSGAAPPPPVPPVPSLPRSAGRQ